MSEQDPEIGPLSEEAERLVSAIKSWAGLNLTPEARDHLRDAFSSLAKAAASVMETRTPTDADEE